MHSRSPKKHDIDSRVATVRSVLESFLTQRDKVKTSRTIELYRSDKSIYIGFSCVCGTSFIKKGNAIRHCKNTGCDASELQNIELIKLCCGRYVSQAQVASFFDEAPRIKEQFDYCKARATLLPFLPQREKRIIHTLICLHLLSMDAVGEINLFIR
jgi:hypothetical protein